MAVEILAKPGLKSGLAEERFELAHHDRRLVVDDRSVELPGLVEVRQVLPDRIGAGRAVHGIGCRCVPDEKVEVVVDVGEARVDDLRGHEVREHFLEPDVVEPLHRDEIAEPHVRGLVRDQARAAEQFHVGRGFVEQQTAGAVQDRPGMLHAPVLKRRDQREVEFLERVVDAGVVFEPVDRSGVQVEDLLDVALDGRRVRFPVQHRHRPAVALPRDHLELASHESKDVRADRSRRPEAVRRARAGLVDGLDRRVGQRAPAGRNRERQFERGLEVGLIEQWESRAGAIRHEQAVEIARIAVQRLRARGEVDFDVVSPGLECGRRDDDVLVLDPKVGGFPVGREAPDRLGAAGEVKLQWRRVVEQVKRDGDAPVDVRIRLLRDIELERVAQPGNRRGALPGEFPRYARNDLRFRCAAGHQSNERNGRSDAHRA